MAIIGAIIIIVLCCYAQKSHDKKCDFFHSAQHLIRTYYNYSYFLGEKLRIYKERTFRDLEKFNKTEITEDIKKELKRIYVELQDMNKENNSREASICRAREDFNRVVSQTKIHFTPLEEWIFKELLYDTVEYKKHHYLPYLQSISTMFEDVMKQLNISEEERSEIYKEYEVVESNRKQDFMKGIDTKYVKM